MYFLKLVKIGPLYNEFYSSMSIHIKSKYVHLFNYFCKISSCKFSWNDIEKVLNETKFDFQNKLNNGHLFWKCIGFSLPPVYCLIFDASLIEIGRRMRVLYMDSQNKWNFGNFRITKCVYVVFVCPLILFFDFIRGKTCQISNKLFCKLHKMKNSFIAKFLVFHSIIE